MPAEDGGIDLYVATQWLHVDQRQMCLALGMPPEKVRLTVHVHACMLALRIGRPVKMVYGREESFYGHVHRHPAWLHYEFGAERDGTLVYARADTQVGSGGSTSASRQTYVTGGAVKAACEAVRATVLQRAAIPWTGRSARCRWTARRSSGSPARC